MTSDRDILWRRCADLGGFLLPLMDQEAWRQIRRHEHLRTWGIDLKVGECLIEVFAALAAHAVAVDTSLSAAELDALPLKAVADAVTGKRDFEFLAGLPVTFSDSRDEVAVNIFRLYAYRGGQTSLWLFQLSREVRYVLVTLAGRSPKTSPTCGDLFSWAAEAGLSK